LRIPVIRGALIVAGVPYSLLMGLRESGYPWWIQLVAAIALIGCFAYLFTSVALQRRGPKVAYVRLLNALKPRPAFDVLVISEESRVGREAIETAYVLKPLVKSW
jgi:hypothetical protein